MNVERIWSDEGYFSERLNTRRAQGFMLGLATNTKIESLSISFQCRMLKRLDTTLLRSCIWLIKRREHRAVPKIVTLQRNRCFCHADTSISETKPRYRAKVLTLDEAIRFDGYMYYVGNGKCLVASKLPVN